MANQPTTGRPWFRLLSQARMAPPAAPQPAPPAPRPLRLPSFAPQPTAAVIPQAQPQPTPTPPTTQTQPPPQPSPPPPPPTQAQPSPEPTPPPSPAQPEPSAPSETPERLRARPPPASPGARVQPTPPASPRPTPSPRLAAASAVRNATPPQSPKVIKSSSPTPPPSPRPRQAPTPVHPTPSPEPEMKTQVVSQQKSMIMQENINNGRVKALTNGNGEFHKNGRNNNHNNYSSSPSPVKEEKSVTYDEKASSATSAWKKKPSRSGDEDETGLRVITIAGENLGAYMELGSNAYRNHSLKTQQGRLLQHQGTNNSVSKQMESGNESGSEIEKHNDNEKAMKGALKTRPIAAVVNSNVQGVNNSLLFSSSCTHNSPGVHIVLSSHHRQPESTNSAAHKAHPAPQ